MATFDNLSNEIHHLVTLNLSDSDLLNLRFLKSFYLHAWMDSQWSVVELDLEDDNCYRHIQRMSDAFVRNRIKDLTIAYAAEMVAFDALCTLLRLPFPSLSHLRNCGFEDSDFDIALFQTISSSPMSHRLRHLKISAHPRTFASYLDGAFQSLEAVALHLSDASSDNPADNDSTAIAPFLLSLSATLKILELTNNTEAVILTPLLVSLSANPGHFRHLKSLSLENGDLDISALRAFLDPYHCDLEQLKLVIFQEESPVDAWLQDVGNRQTCFPSLQALRISNPTTPRGLSFLSTLLKRVSSTLSTLKLVEPLTIEALSQLFDELTERPSLKVRCLSIAIDTLTIPLLDLLATKLPQLEKLSLQIVQVDPSEDSRFFWNTLSSRAYQPDMTSHVQDVLHIWNLRYLKITFISKQFESTHDDLCSILMSTIGSLEEVRSKGHMHEIGDVGVSILRA